MAYTYNAVLLLGSAQTGLSATLRAALQDTSGTIHATLRDISTGFIEIGGGIYQWSSSSIPDGYRGVVVFYTGTLASATDFTGVTLKTASPVSPQETENSDVKTSGRAASGDAMTLADGAITPAKIATPAESPGRPTDILGMIRRLWEWSCNRRERDRDTGVVNLRNSTDNGNLEQQVQSTTGNVDSQTKGA